MKKSLKKMLEHIPKATKIFVNKQADIALRISDILNEKKLHQRDLAKMLEVSESRISKILAGNENMTLKTIAKIEGVLDSVVIEVNNSITQVQFQNVWTNTSYVNIKPSNVRLVKNFKTLNLDDLGGMLLMTMTSTASHETQLMGDMH